MVVMEEMVGKWKMESRDDKFEQFLLCRQVTGENENKNYEP